MTVLDNKDLDALFLLQRCPKASQKLIEMFQEKVAILCADGFDELTSRLVVLQLFSPKIDNPES